MFVTFTEKKSARFHNWRYYSVFNRDYVLFDKKSRMSVIVV